MSYETDERDKYELFPAISYEIRPGIGKVYETLVPYRFLTKSGTVYSWRGKPRQKDRNGWIAPNDFEVTEVKWKPGLFDLTVYHRSGNTLVWEGYPALEKSSWFNRAPYYGAVQEAVSKAERAMEQAKAEAYAEANSPSKCPGLTWIAEGKESAQWLAKIAKKARKATMAYILKTRNIKRGKKKGVSAKEIADQLSDAWLTYRYAITPLALQIQDMLELFADKQEKLEVVSGYIKTEQHINEYSGTMNWYGQNVEIIRTDTIKIVGACKLYPSASKSQDKLSAYGITPWDAVLAAWEVTKLSFVIDWFVNVGDFLAAYRPGGANIAYQSNTYVIEYKVETVCKDLGYGDPLGSSDFKCSSSVTRTTKIKRDTIVSRPDLPVFTVESLSLFRLTDAAALLFKMFKSIRK